MKTWKRYGLEFLSIFIAVVAAFGLNNWNDNRKRQQAESKILAEIYHGLEKDTEDLVLNEMGHKAGIEAVRYFRGLLADKPVAKDSMLLHYFSLTRDFVSIQNTSGYETLKSRGFELIDNDSLRTKIISLYEYDYNTLRKLEEEYHELQFQENYFKEINRSIARNFEYDEHKFLTGIRTPLKISEEEEKVFLSYLWKIGSNRGFVLQYYGLVKNKIEVLRAEIKQEMTAY